MTQKEKARAYDEALKLARDYHEDKNCFEYLKGVLEHIFPELKESDDIFKWADGKLDKFEIRTDEELKTKATIDGKLNQSMYQGLQGLNNLLIDGNERITPKRIKIVEVCNDLQKSAENFQKAVKKLKEFSVVDYYDFKTKDVDEDEVKKRVKDANFITGKGFKTMSDYAELSFGMDDIKKIDDAQWKNQRMAMARYAVYQYVKDNSSLDSNKTVIKSVGDCEDVENWKTFVTSLKIPESCWIVTAGKKIGSMVNKYAIPFEDFIDDQIQWSHGFEGRILMSDSKNRTAYFDSSQKLTYTKNRNYFEENLKELNKALVCFV